MVVRMYPKYEVEKVWQYLEGRFSKEKHNDVVPLFMSEQDYQNFVSVICDVRVVDALADFLANDIAPCRDIVSTRTVTLVKPVFHPVPKTISSEMCRFLVQLKVNASFVSPVYSKILETELPKGLYYAYTSLSLGEDDILMSLLAKDWELIKKFVSGRIDGTPGISSTKIMITHRTKKLVNDAEWLDCQKKYSKSRFVKTAVDEMYEYDWTSVNNCSFHGALDEKV